MPGHGGLAVIFGLRVHGATDHTGRPDPPFSHAIAAIDRELDGAAIEAACVSFHRHIMGGASQGSEGAAFYRAYAAARTERSAEEAALVARYVASFGDLPRPMRSRLTQGWRVEGHGRAERVVIVHPDGAPFSQIASCAARLASILYRSDARWTSITTGREADIVNGVSIRLVPERDAHGNEVSGALAVRIDEIPREDAEAAFQLFRARVVEHRARAAARAEGWRGGYAEGHAEAKALEVAEGASSSKEPPETERALIEVASPAPDVTDEGPVMPSMEAPPSVPGEPERPRSTSRRWGYIFTASAMGVAALLWVYQSHDERSTVLEPIRLAPVAGEDLGLTEPRPAPALSRKPEAHSAPQGDLGSGDASAPASKPGGRVRGRNASVPAATRREERRTDDNALLFPSLPGQKGDRAPK